MKLERISAAAQTELPNARPLNRNHKVSNMSAPVPDKNSNAQKIATPSLGRGACAGLICGFGCKIVLDLVCIFAPPQVLAGLIIAQSRHNNSSVVESA